MADLNNIGEHPDLYKLFVGQIPKDMDELSLRPYFEEFGHIVEISIIRDNITMMSKGDETRFAYLWVTALIDSH
jgi:RNA recognition motif-containing protein